MKAIILLLVFSSGLFADTIKYQKFFKSAIYENVKFLGIKDNKVYFLDDEENVKWLACQLVGKILDSENRTINYDCNLNTYDMIDNPITSASKVILNIFVVGAIVATFWVGFFIFIEKDNIEKNQIGS